jgi:hypothetical protein
VLRYSIKLNSGPPTSALRDGFGTVAGSVPYRVLATGHQPATSGRAHLELAGDVLVLRERNPSNELLRLPLESIVATAHPGRGIQPGGWHGLEFDGSHDRADLPPVEGSLVVAYTSPARTARVGLANCRGLLVAKARADHFTIVGRWLGILAAVAAEDRWMAVGPRRHAEELGLSAAVPGAAGSDLAPESGAADRDGRDPGHAGAADRDGRDPGHAGAAGEAAGVRAALEALEDLRGHGLVTRDEYDAKRREILARL